MTVLRRPPLRAQTPSVRPPHGRARRTVVALACLISALVGPLASPAQTVAADGEVVIDLAPPLQRLPLWILDLAGLPLLPTVQSVLDGATWQACATPGPVEAERCSLPVPLFTPVPVDVDQAALSGGLLGRVAAPDFDVALGLVVGDAESAANLLDPGQLAALGDGVALRFEIRRALTDALDGTRATHGRIYARFHLPAVGYDAILGFDSPVALADQARVTLGVRGEDIPAATTGRFAADFVLTHTPAPDHALLVGLARVERDGLFGRRALDPLQLALRFDAAPSRMTGDLRAEQVPDFEGLAVAFTLPPGERPALSLVARQDFNSADRLQPDVAVRHLRADLARMPGAATVEVAHDRTPAGRDRVSARLGTSAAIPSLRISEALERSAGGVDQLVVGLTDLPALDCGPACTTVRALLPRALAAQRFDPVVTGDFGVDPAAAAVSLTLQTERAGETGAFAAEANTLPVRFALDANVDLLTQAGILRWSANRPGTRLERVAIDTQALRAELAVLDLPPVIDLAFEPTRLRLRTADRIGRLRGWLSTGATHPALRPDAHLVGAARLADQADLRLALDLPGVGSLDLTTVDCAGYLCADLGVPGGALAPVELDLDARIATADGLQTVRVAGTLAGLPPTTTLRLSADAIDLTTDATIGADLVAAIGPDARLAGIEWAEPGQINAVVDPAVLRASLNLPALPQRLRLNLAAIRDLRGLGDPADAFAPDPAAAIKPTKPTWRSPIEDATPLAALGAIPAGRLDLDVTLLDAAGAPDLTVRGGLVVGSPIEALTVGPLAVNGADSATRGLEARLRRVGGALAVDGLTVAIRQRPDAPDRDVLRADVPTVPPRFDLFAVVGGPEINLPGRFSVDFKGLALLLEHDGDLPALGVAYRDEALPRQGDWQIVADLSAVPERVWLVTSGGRGGESTSGCVGLFIPTPSLEYVASKAGLGLDVALQGSLLSPNIDATSIEARIDRLPVRASINALNNGAGVLQIAGFADAEGRTRAFIEGLAINLDATLHVRLDCGISVGDRFQLSGGVRIGDAGRATLHAGRIGLGLDGVRAITLDFGDVWGLFGLLGLSVDWSGLYLDLRDLSLDVNLPVRGELKACATGSVGEATKRVCGSAGVGATVNLSAGLEPFYFDTGRKTTIREVSILGCDVGVYLGVGRQAEPAGAEMTMVFPHGLPGGKALAILAAAYLVVQGDLSPRDLLSFDVDCAP